MAMQLGDILAWGMSDRYSWLQQRTPRADGLPKRPCPYDADFRAKPPGRPLLGFRLSKQDNLRRALRR